MELGGQRGVAHCILFYCFMVFAAFGKGELKGVKGEMISIKQLNN